MTIQRVSDIEGEPVVGRFYMVSCVLLYVPGVRGGLWPVLTPSHRDPELNADFEHFHYDWRFVSRVHFESVLTVEAGGDETRVYSVVGRLSFYGGAELIERRMLCKRVPQPFPSHNADGTPNRVTRVLEPKYRERSLSACLTCPHKGLSLKNQPVRDGKIVCPGHGLAWDVNTGKMVPRC